MQVSYKYGLDSYRLLVKPENPAIAPFKEIEFEWSRGKKRARENLKNIAPQFPEPTAWEENDLKRYQQWFIDAAENLDEYAYRIFDQEEFHDSCDELLWQLNNLKNLIEKKLAPPCRSLWRPDKKAFVKSHEFNSVLVEKVSKWLVRLTTLSTQDESLKDAVFSLKSTVLETISYLRSDAPSAILAHIEKNISKNNEERRMALWMSRVIGDGKGDRKKFLQRLLAELKQRFEYNRQTRGPIKKYSYLLWGLATALWRNPNLVNSLQNISGIDWLLELIEYDCRGIIHTLEKFKNKNQNTITNQSLHFRTINEILMALLRLRPQECAVEAGTQKLIKLARYLKQIDRLLLHNGYTCESCFQFEWKGHKKPKGMSELIFVLTSYLSGEAVSELIRIKSIVDAEQKQNNE